MAIHGTFARRAHSVRAHPKTMAEKRTPLNPVRVVMAFTGMARNAEECHSRCAWVLSNPIPVYGHLHVFAYLNWYSPRSQARILWRGSQLPRIAHAECNVAAVARVPYALLEHDRERSSSSGSEPNAPISRRTAAIVHNFDHRSPISRFDVRYAAFTSEDQR